MDRLSCLIKLLITLIVIGLGHYIYAQPENLRYKYLTVDNGLSSSTIMCIYQDHKGFIWIGTYDGLNRYDGSSFLHYKNAPSDPNSIAADLIRVVTEDHNNVLLIGSAAGLSAYNNNTGKFRNYMRDSTSALYNNICTVHKIVEDSLYNLWLATNIGLFYFNPIKNTLIKYLHNENEPNSLSNDFVESVYSDNKKRLWVATREGLNLFQPKTNSFRLIYKSINKKEDFSKIGFIEIIEDIDGTMWFGSESGVFCIKGLNVNKDILLTHYPHNPSVPGSISSNRTRVLYIDDNNDLWLGTENGGINIYDRQKNIFRNIRKDNNNIGGISNESIWAIFQDDIKNYWLGTFGGGINISMFNSKAIEHYNSVLSSKNALSHNVVSSFCEDYKGRLWIGTDGGGLNLMDRGKKNFTYINTGNSAFVSNAILDIIEDSKKRIWITFWDGGIACMNSDTKEIKTYTIQNSELPDNNIFSIVEGDNNDFWLGSFTHGLIHFSLNDNKFESYSPENSNVFYAYIFILKKDPKGQIYMGSTNGFQILNPKSFKINTYRYFLNNSANQNNLNNPYAISHENVHDIVFENDTSVWVATQNGLNNFNPVTQKFNKYFKEDGLPNSVIKGLIIDNNGNLWVTTNYGVSQFDLKRKRFRNFTKEDGLQSNEFFFNSTGKDHNGNILLGGINGFNIIDPQKITYNKHIPRVLITDLEIFNKPVIPGTKNSPLLTDISDTKEIVFTHNQSVFTFYFAAMDFTAPEKNQYAYMMEGFDKDWIYCGNRKNATYTNLDPGNYVFRVKGSNNDEIWNETGVSLKIIILPPWWQTIWFKLLVVVFIISMLILIYVYKVLSLQKRQIYLQKLVSERTQEIEEKNNVLIKQTSELNESNAILEERQQFIEEQNELLIDRTERLNRSNMLLVEKQKHIEEQSKEIIRKNEELVKLNATKDKFFTIIAHDLKNPFNAILGFCEIITLKYDNFDDNKKKQLINSIFTSSKNIYKLLENLLQWARSQTGEIKFNPEVFLISDVIDNNIIIVNDLLKEKKLELITINTKSLSVYADKNMISTVLRNLITNAIKFTRKGNITIECYCENTHILVKVKDTGVGIPPEKLNDIFNVAGSKSTYGTNGESGTGLGLILCKEFVLKNKGTIGVESEVGKGSTFYFTLPCKKS